MQNPAVIPAEAKNAVPVLRNQLAESLLAVYLHGSAVAGGLRPQSDVDLLVVIDRPMRHETRESLAVELLKLSGLYPSDPDGRRPLEVIVFVRPDSDFPLQYPARSEFIYGEWLRHELEKGKTPGPAADPEFTLIVAQARREAKPLLGPDVSELLPAVSETDVRRAIFDGLPTLIRGLDGDERNVLLTLARMWRTLVTGEFVSKDVAAEWAIARLPARQATVLSEARKEYLGLQADSRQDRRSDVQQTALTLHDLCRLSDNATNQLNRR